MRLRNSGLQILRHPWLIAAILSGLLTVAALFLHASDRQSNTQARAPRAPVMHSISEANMSPDGTFLALEGAHILDDAAEDTNWGVQFLDLASRAVVAWSPRRWQAFLPSWGRGHAYLMPCDSPLGARQFVWASSPVAQASVLRAPTEGTRFGLRGFLTADHEWAIAQVHSRPPGRSKTQTMAVPLAGGKPQAIRALPSDVQLTGVVPDPTESGGSLILAGGTREGPLDRPGVSATCFPGRTICWRTLIGDRQGILDGSALYDTQTLLICEEPLTASAVSAGYDPELWWLMSEDYPPPTLATKIWMIDLRDGDSQLFAKIPLAFRSLSVLNGGSSDPLVFFGGLVRGGVAEVWRIVGPPGSAQADKVVRGPKGSRPAGARQDPTHGIEIYMTTRHCVWRCRLKDGTVERIWGTPGDDDHPPRVFPKEAAEAGGSQSQPPPSSAAAAPKPSATIAQPIESAVTEEAPRLIEAALGSLPEDALVGPLYDARGWHAACVLRRDEGVCLWLDGKLGPRHDSITPSSVTFSPDSRRIAYAAAEDGSHFVVVDGQAGRGWKQVAGLTFSPDSRHVGYFAKEDGRWTAVIDGKPGRHYGTIVSTSVVFSDHGGHAAYVAREDSRCFVVLDGQRQPEYDWISPDTLALGPHGQRTAYYAKAGDKFSVVVDGAPDPECEAIGKPGPRFSPDGSRVAYVVIQGAKQFVVVDRQQQPAFDAIMEAGPYFGPNGQHLAYAAMEDGKWFVVRDGEPGPQYDGIGRHSISFSPDGQHLAYVAMSDGKWFSILDGVPGPAYDAMVEFVFSPDSKSWAYGALEGGEWRVVWNGRAGPGRFTGMGSLRFSPNGRHLAYGAGTGPTPVVVLDEHLISTSHMIIGTGPAFRPDGTLEFLATRGGELYRLTVQPDSSPSFDDP